MNRPGQKVRDSDRLRTYRRRLYDVLELGRVAGWPGALFEYGMVALILANVVAVAAETVDPLRMRYGPTFFYFELFSVLVFTVEYLLRVWVSPERAPDGDERPWRSRARYVFTPLAMIDLLAFLPFYLVIFATPDLRFLRIFRLVRLLKLIRYSPAVASLTRVIYNERRALMAALVIMSGLLFFSATLMYLVERDVQPQAFASIPSALWWAIATFTTVGYGDVVPISVAGKIVGGMVMIFGLAFYAIPIGIIASGFSEEIHRREFIVRRGLVAKIPLFQDLDSTRFDQILDLMHAMIASPGTIITHRGDTANGLYIVLSGESNAYLGRKTVRLKPGDVFGEFGIVMSADGEPTVVSRTPCHLVHLSSHDFHYLLSDQPVFRERLTVLSERRLNQLVSSGRLDEEEAEEIREQQRKLLHI